MADYEEAIKTAIESAMQERSQLLDKLKEFDKLKEQLGQIEAFINQGRLLLGGGYAKSEIKSPTQAFAVSGQISELFKSLPGKTNAEKIVEVLKATGRAMTVPEIVKEFKARNWQLGEKNRMQIIRNTLKGKEGVLFKKIGIGLWDLMERAA
ncbi:MAG: hypothetical protein WCB64_09625 [Desulfobaccales bacterium]